MTVQVETCPSGVPISNDGENTHKGPLDAEPYSETRLSVDRSSRWNWNLFLKCWIILVNVFERRHDGVGERKTEPGSLEFASAVGVTSFMT